MSHIHMGWFCFITCILNQYESSSARTISSVFLHDIKTAARWLPLQQISFCKIQNVFKNAHNEQGSYII